MTAVPTQAPPAPVRIAGAVVGLQGLAGLVFAVALLVRAFVTPQTPGANPYAMAVYYLLLGGAVTFAGVSLVRGRRWARAPAVVVQLLLLGTAWFAVEGASQWAIGVPVAAVCLAVLVLLFVAPSRQWAIRQAGGRETGDAAATDPPRKRDGSAGRR